jgi:predicted ATPase
VPDPTPLVAARNVLGQTLFHLGEFELAHEHFEQGIAVYDPQTHHSLASLYGTDQGLHCLVFVAYALWALGYPDQALKRIHEALTLTQKFSHPFSRALVLTGVTAVHLFRREAQATQERAEATIALCSEQGFVLNLAIVTLWRGWALVEQGQGEEGIAQIQQGLATWRAIGAELFRPGSLGQLAEAYGKMGQGEEGLSALAEALAVVDKTGVRFCKAELYRLKGELVLQSGVQGPASESLILNPQLEAEVCFQKAIEVALHQRAKSLELRAVMSLSRLWQQQGKKDEARRLLAEIYGWFTEGFDTKDLQEAKALLEELSH